MKRVSNKKKAFSLTELLAIIVIIGIFSILAIASVTKYVEKSRNEKDNQNKNTTEMAAELFMQDHQNKLPVMIGDSVKIDLSELLEAGYLKENVTNAKKEDCMEKSFVRVYKLSKTEYSYYTYLYCGKEKVPAEVEVPKPVVIDFKFIVGNFNGNSFDDVKDAKFSFKIKGAENDDTVGIKGNNNKFFRFKRKKGKFKKYFILGN